MKKATSLILGLVLTAMVGCNNSTDKTQQTESQTTTVDTTEESASINMQEKSLVGMINGTIYCVPSPYGIMKHIKECAVPYNSVLPNSIMNMSLYQSQFQRLINWGIYGIDISYMSIHEQTQEVMTYFASLKSLANQLELSTIFDASTMERIEANIENQDSLLTILVSKYQESDKLLKGENQKAEAALIMTGCWLESLYLLTQHEKMQHNNSTMQRIADHKFATETIVNILRPYHDKNQEFKELIEDIIEICYEFDGISYKYTYKEPTTVPKQHLTIINSETELCIEQKHAELITDKVEKLRKKITQ